MAKPIFIIKVPFSFFKDNDISELRNDISSKLEGYHVLIISDGGDNFTFECYNDCKGLPDIDIEKLIKEFNNK